jgi:glycosyltransferase involved in cell wall biosynthesis
MHIFLFIYSLQPGGAERVGASLANHWASTGCRVTVATLTASATDFYALHPAVERIAFNLAEESETFIHAISNNARRIAELRRVLRQLRPTVAIGMMSVSGILLILASLFLSGCAVVVAERSYPPLLPLGRIWRLLRRLVYARSTVVVMQTREGVEWLEREIPRARGVRIPNPIMVPLNRSAPELVPKDVLEKSDRKLLLAVGRLTEEKGFDILLEAFASLYAVYHEWDLVIIGEGPLRTTLERHLASLGLEGRAFMPGRTGCLVDWYQRADIFALCSRYEGFPNVLGEAMAHGCAVVSFDCDTGPRDLIRHAIDGLLVPPGNLNALREALGSLMHSENMRREFGKRALEIKGRYSLERIDKLWRGVFAMIESKAE